MMNYRNREGGFEKSRGIIPRAFEQIFLELNKIDSDRTPVSVRGSCFHIYQGKVYDNLRSDWRKEVDIKQVKYFP